MLRIVLVFGTNVKHLFRERKFASGLDSERAFVVLLLRTDVPILRHSHLRHDTDPSIHLAHEERPMAAVTIPVQPPPAYVANAPTAATFRRRRLTALLATVVIALVVTTVAVRAAAAFGAQPASRPERRPDPAATVVAQPGDSLWSIARRLQPEGDIRALVDALVRANGGASLDIGDRVAVP
jgi:hypothetical protein